MHIVDELIAERARRLMSFKRFYSTIKPVLFKALLYDKAVKLADDVRPLSGHQAFNLVSDLIRPDVRVTGLENLPATGACILISNHPTGLADGIAVFDAIKEKRPEHVFLANADALRVMPKCEDVVIPVEWVKSKRSLSKTRETLSRTRQAFKDDRCVVIFPSGSLALMTFRGLKDRPWESSAAMLAKKYNIPIVPLRIKARNSGLYYVFEKTNNELRDITLFRELLNKRDKRFDMTFGSVISPDDLPSNAEEATAKIRKIVENL